jgi:hypothetical protein
LDLSLLQLADGDLEWSLRALGPFSYHVEGNGPSKPMEIGHSALSGPSEQREGLKRQHADKEQPGSGGSPKASPSGGAEVS